MKQIQFINKKGRSKLILVCTASLVLLIYPSCKKQLDVKNPNSPTFQVNVKDEGGLTSYAKGVIYWNGFNYGDVWLGDSYFSLPQGYHELMGDLVGGGQGSNNQMTTMGVPDHFLADPSDQTTLFTNPAPQAKGIIRTFNNPASTAQGNNALYYEWTNMYAMIKGCNLTLDLVDGIPLSVDKANTMKAWAYWWKGYAYAEIGTLYYAGLIVEQANSVANEVVNKFVKQSDIVAESNKNLNLAMTTLKAITNQGDYDAIVKQLIPAQNQAGLGKPLSSTQWIRTINTMLARNILLNHLSPFVNGNASATISKSTITPMSASDWQSVLAFCNNGIQQGDFVFTGRTSATNSFFTADGGSVAGIISASNQTTTLKLGERLVQQFKAGDKRLGNFTTASGTFYGDANTNSTRYSLVDAVTAGLTGFTTLGTRAVGKLELYIGPTYEENQLMIAEAKMRTGDINGGLTIIDNVRDFQGAGVAHVGGTGLTLSDALKELTMERLGGLAFRGLSYFDLRRWGWTYAIANGGGRYGCTILFKGNVYTNATFDYNFMDYWDVPGDETAKNPPSSDSAPVMNVNY